MINKLVHRIIILLHKINAYAPQIPKEGIFLTINPLRAAAALLSLLRLLGFMVSSVLLVDSDGQWKLTLTLSILSCWMRVIPLLNCSCGILI